MSQIVFLILIAKLGIFPFFYWMVVVSLKIRFLGNIFVLSLQKLRVFWLLWLLNNISFSYLYLFGYLRLFFVIFSLMRVVDFWLFLVLTSIANTSLILIRILGFNYFNVIFLYLFIIVIIIYYFFSADSLVEIAFIVFFFIVVPPFLLFFLKFYVVYSLDFFLKIGFFFSLFDVFILFYYFSFVFIKFILIDLSIIFYFINFLWLIVLLLYRNYVAMIIFNKS